MTEASVVDSASQSSAARMKGAQPEARGATNGHYDQDPAVFKLFLDPTMKYSSGLFLHPDDDLTRAQQHKLDYIAGELGAAPGKLMLDIGCGWGSLALHLAGKYGCRVVGLTPAPHQAQYIRGLAAERGLSNLVEVHITHFQDTAFPVGSFDGISLVGSIVHMPNKATVLEDCFRIMKHRGQLYLSESCYRNAARKRAFEERPGSLHVANGIFGWVDMPPVSTYVEQLEDAGFSLTGLRDLTQDYYRTIEVWKANLLKNRDAFEQAHPGGAESYLRYFDVANAGWGYTTKHYAVTARRTR